MAQRMLTVRFGSRQPTLMGQHEVRLNLQTIGSTDERTHFAPTDPNGGIKGRVTHGTALAGKQSIFLFEAIMFKHILLATDGSIASDHAATMAIGLARTHGAKLMVVYVVDPYPYLGIGEANPYGFQAYMSAAQTQAADAHAKVNALCMQSQPPVDMQARLIEQVTPATGIVQTAMAEGADLIQYCSVK